MEEGHFFLEWIEEEKAQVGTDEYIEKVARDKLGMCKEDEKIFIDGKEN